ncbi:uncharacterized protein ACDL77_003656 [Rhynchocyon petersi]
MIHFCLAHTAHYVHCWLPRLQMIRLWVTVSLLGLAALAVQFYVLLRPRSSQYCSQPLLINLVVSIIFTFFAIGFTVLLIQLEPVPMAIKKMFSAFGVLSFGEGVCTLVLTVLAKDCEKTTPELYYMSVLLSVSSLTSTAKGNTFYRSPIGRRARKCVRLAEVLSYVCPPACVLRLGPSGRRGR